MLQLLSRVCFWLRLPTFMIENSIQSSILARGRAKYIQLHLAWTMPRCPTVQRLTIFEYSLQMKYLMRMKSLMD